ncbi:MAG: acyl-CoA synthetase [Kineosporiaceae bacterium]|nr:acyl-CoA synthetase [Kineosporiaceae bacterium]
MDSTVLCEGEHVPSSELLAPLTGPDATDSGHAVTVAGRTLTRAELVDRAGALAQRLTGAGSVAVHATATLETVVAVTGALLAGVPVVPLPPDSGPAERTHLLRDSGAELVLVDDAAQAPQDIAAGAVPVIGLADLPHRPDGAWSPAHADPATTALIVYTSGTTGAPKGAVLSRRAVAAGLDALFDAWGWTAQDTLVHGLPLFHVHGLVLGVLGALRAGSPLVHTGRPTPEAYAAAGGTLYFGVPTVWARITAEPAAAGQLRTARLLVSGSAALPVPVFERLAALTGHRAVERYGMTETMITLATRADGERRPGWVGLPVRSVQTRLVHEGRDVAPDGQTPGELWVRGPTLFDGYHARPAATAEVLDADGWMHTGDIAVTGPDGWHRIVGRASTDLISSGGYRIGAGEVEDALLAHPGVREAAVIGTPHPDLGEQVTAFVVADGVEEGALVEFVAHRLSVHKRPRVVRLVTSLPRNAMGKVVKTRLR